MGNRPFFLLGIALVTAMLTVLLFLCAGASQAQPPPIQPSGLIVTDPDRMIWDAIGINPGDDMYPDIAYNSQDDEYLVVFEWPDSGSGIGRDLVSIRVDASGQAALSPNGVAVSTAYTDTRPAVAYNPTNNTYLVVWERSPGNGGKDICRAVLNASGTISGTEYIVAGWDGNQLFPDVAYSAVDDRYLVVWEDYYAYWTYEPNIYGAVLDEAGASVAFENVTGDVLGDQTLPSVAANTVSGSWLVTWQDSRNSGTTENDIYGQQMSVSGSTLSPSGPQVAIGTLSGWAGAPDVVWGQPSSGDDAFLTVWAEDSVLYGQRVAADSTLTGDPTTISDYESAKSVPAVAFDTVESEWWVVWADNRDYG